MSSERLWQHGEQYAGAALDPTSVDPDPIAQFRRWFAEAEAAKAPQVNAMTLATIDPDGRPSARIVLLKEVDADGFVFFTNYESRKGVALAANPVAAIVFHWDVLHRQVRAVGAVERISGAASDAYFAVRPRGSQLGAIASPQSRALPDRGQLESAVASLALAHADAAPPRPPHWGGYRLIPDEVELWQGQPSRLHDRVHYRRTGDAWTRARLAP